MSTIEGRPAELLSGKNHAVISTLREDGSVHSAVVWVNVEDGKAAVNSAVGRDWPANLERDPRACVAISRPVSMAHVIVWGTVELRWDPDAQAIWDAMIRGSFGEEGLAKRRRVLSREGTMLGLMTPQRQRIYGID